MRSLAIALIFLMGSAFANRLDVFVNGNLATFKATGPHPFVLLTQNIAARYPTCNTIVIFIPPEGLPPLRFRIGNELHETKGYTMRPFPKM